MSIDKANQSKSANPGMGKSLNLRTKATLLAIAIGTVPVLATGATGYYFANKSIGEQVTKFEESQAIELQDKVDRFMEGKLQDIKAMATLYLLTSQQFTPIEQEGAIKRYQQANPVYDSIAIFDLKGNPIAQTDSGKKLSNHLDRPYIQEALKADGAVLSQPTVSKSTGTYSLYAASTIKNLKTGKTIGIIRSRIPVSALAEVIKNYKTEGRQYYLVNDVQEVFLGQEETSASSGGENSEHKAVLLEEIFANLKSAEGEEAQTTSATNQLNNSKQIVVSPPPSQVAAMANLNWKTLIAEDEKAAFAPQRNLGLTLAIGIGVTTLLVSAIAAYLANRATMPLLDAVKAVKKIGSGDLDTRLKVDSQDELGELNSNINLMTAQIQNSLEEQKGLAAQQRQEKEKLEMAIYTLLEEVSAATDGDLTVRANLDSMEISTVADLFNAIIGNLQDIAIEAKQSTRQVGSSLKANEEEIRLLAEQAIAETKEARETLMSVQQMALSIQAVAANASQAEKITDDTYNTIVSSTPLYSNGEILVGKVTLVRPELIEAIC